MQSSETGAQIQMPEVLQVTSVPTPTKRFYALKGDMTCLSSTTLLLEDRTSMVYQCNPI